MIKQQPNLMERATAIAKRDQLRPFLCTRRDTDQPLWLVQSRSDPSRYYLLTVSGDDVSCACPQAQHHGICAHAAAVHIALQSKPQPAQAGTPADQPVSTPIPRRSPHSETQRERESRQRVEVERRERALLWTDDKPFSIWKS